MFRQGWYAGLKRRKAFVVDEQVAKILRQSIRPIGAYEIAAQLPHVATAQVYRALERHVSNGKARRIASRKAFIPLSCNGGLTTLCSICGEYKMFDCSEAIMGLARLCDDQDFQRREIFLEMTGICQNCQGT